MRWLIFVVFGSICLWAASDSRPPTETLIFTHVNVIDTRHGVILDNMVVIVAGGRIERIGKLGLISVDRRVHVVNATGLYMIPGLWDMNAHSTSGPRWGERVIYPLYFANGVMGIRDVGDSPELLEKPQRQIDSGQLPGPRIVSAMLLKGFTAKGGEVSVQDTAAQAREIVQVSKEHGAGFVYLESELQRDSYFALADETVKLKTPLIGMVPNSVRITEASSAGQRSIERLAGISLACSSRENDIRSESLRAMARQDRLEYASLAEKAFDSYDPAKAWSIFVQLADNNTWQVPSLVWSQSVVTGENHAADSTLKFAPASVVRKWQETAQTASGDTQRVLQKQADLEIELVSALRRAGVRFMTGTNGPDRWVLPGFSVHTEMELLVKSGFTPLEALQAATINPALFLERLDRFGVVEPGRNADLVLLRGNPLLDIRNTRAIEAIVLNGRYYSRKQLDEILAQASLRAAKE